MLKKIKNMNHTTIGPVPFRIYLVSAIILSLSILTKTLPNNIMGGLAVMLIFGWLFYSIGNSLPLLRKLGGGTLLAMLFPAVLVYYSLIPSFVYETVRFTFEDVNMANFFMFSIIVGSINAIPRQQFLKGMIGLFVPLFSSLFLTYAFTLLVGLLLNFDASQSFFRIIVPAMAGGVAPGILPLAQGYSDILAINEAQLVSILTPALILSNVMASLYASLLNVMGQKFPHLTGNGQLSRMEDKDIKENLSESINNMTFKSTDQSITVGLIYVISMYLISYSISIFIQLPTAVIGLLLSIVVKVFRMIPCHIEQATIAFRRSFSSFFSSGILCGIGMLYFDLDNVFKIITWQYVLLIFVLVTCLVVFGFLTSRVSKSYPIDTAVVTLNLAALGAMGNVAILSASERESLMPFAQIATRIGGAFNITYALLLLNFLN